MIMKRIHAILFFILSCLALSAQQASDAPRLEFVCELKVTIGQARVVGPTPQGDRVVIPITGGTFEGPAIKGEVLAGGADYQLIDRAHNRTYLEAIYCIRTADGVTIHVRNEGVLTQSDKGFYFMTSPRFEAPIGSAYEWLNNAVFVCRPSVVNGVVCLKVWKVL